MIQNKERLISKAINLHGEGGRGPGRLLASFVKTFVSKNPIKHYPNGPTNEFRSTLITPYAIIHQTFVHLCVTKLSFHFM